VAARLPNLTLADTGTADISLRRTIEALEGLTNESDEGTIIKNKDIRGSRYAADRENRQIRVKRLPQKTERALLENGSGDYAEDLRGSSGESPQRYSDFEAGKISEDELKRLEADAILPIANARGHLITNKRVKEQNTRSKDNRGRLSDMDGSGLRLPTDRLPSRGRSFCAQVENAHILVICHKGTVSQ